MTYCTIEEAWGDNFIKPPEKKKKKKKLSRNYKRLSNHMIEKSRMPELNNGNAIYENTDLPINDYKVDNEFDIPGYSDFQQNNSVSYPDNNFSEFNDYSDVTNNVEDEENDNNINSIQDKEIKENFLNLINENENLKNFINNLNKSSENDNILDLLLFISSGIFIIFLLEILVKCIKKN